MPYFSYGYGKLVPRGKRPWLKAWRYPGVPIPFRLQFRYEVKS